MTKTSRLQRLEDIEDIRRLKLRYATLCDDGYRADALADLFTPDGVWDGGEAYGRYEGHEAIEEYWRECGQNIPFAIHFILNHVVDVDPNGDRAKGSCNLLQPMTLDGRATWAAVRYDEVYRRHLGDWCFETMTLTTLLLAPHDEGW